MKIQVLSLFLLLLIGFSCKNPISNKTTSARIDKGSEISNIEMKVVSVEMDTKHTLPFDSLIEFISFIKLETTSENLIDRKSVV